MGNTVKSRYIEMVCGTVKISGYRISRMAAFHPFASEIIPKYANIGEKCLSDTEYKCIYKQK